MADEDNKVAETKEEVTEAVEAAEEAAEQAEEVAEDTKAEAAAEKVEQKVEQIAEAVEKHEAAEAKAEARAEKVEKAEVPAKFKDLVKSIESLSVLELSELVKVLEDHFGVSAAAPMAMAAAPAGGGGAEAAVEEKSAYTVVLAASGDQKINVIKAVREITGLGLAESKALVDGAPKTVKENLPKAEADEAKKALEAAGATVELK
jgi:large subunit ribosomal protein L7/L12